MEVVVVLSGSFGGEMTLIQMFLRGAKGMRLVLARNSSSWPGLRRKVVYQRYHHTNPGKHLVHLAYMAMFCRGFKHQISVNMPPAAPNTSDLRVYICRWTKKGTEKVGRHMEYRFQPTDSRLLYGELPSLIWLQFTYVYFLSRRGG